MTLVENQNTTQPNVAQQQVETKAAAQPAAKATTEKGKGRVLQAKPAKVQPIAAIADGEPAKRELTIDEGKKTATATYSFKLSENDTQRYQKTTVFDFSGCTTSELIELAVATVRITTQRNLRALGKGALDPSAFSHINVKRDIVDATQKRESVDDITKAVRALMAATNMSHEAALALVEGEAKRNQTAKK